jgi:Ca-activated chloride channel family protein
LLLLSVVFIVLALARPRYGFQWREVARGGIDIMVVLDLSQSMNATDLKPNRLERSKRKVMDLLNMLEGDRIGIIGFGGVPFVQCPLTSDYRLANLFIDQMSTKLMPVQGTAIGDALRLAVKHLMKSSSSNSEGKAILLITDGEDHETKPLVAAEFAEEKGIKIFTLGIGGLSGAPIPIAGGGYKKDQNGNVVISKLDEETLKKIALTTGGSYARSLVGDEDLSALYQKGIRRKTSDGDYGTDKQKVWYERFQWFVALALLCLLGDFLIRGSSQIKTKKAVSELLSLLIIIFLGLSFYSQPSYAENVSLKEAEKAFEKKDYDTAVKGYTEAEIKNPDDASHPYNRGVSQFQKGDFDQAVEGFSKSAKETENKILKQNAIYNQGNSYVAKGDLEKAVKSYEQALKLNPKDKQAKDNLGWVKKEIKKQKQKKKSDKNNKDNKKQDDKNKEKQDSEQESDKSDKQDKQDKKNQQKNKPSDDKNEDKDKNQQKKSDEEKKQDETKKEQNKQEKQQQEKQEKQNEDNKQGKQASKDNKEASISEQEAKSLLESFENQDGDQLPKPRIDTSKRSSKFDW